VVHVASLRSAVALLIVLTLCAGCGSSGSPKVSAKAYVKSVCSAISPLERDIQAHNNASAPSAAQAKKSLQTFLNAIELDSEHAVSQIRSAGTPDISNGKAVAGTIVKAFTEVRDAIKLATAKSSSLPTGSATAFKAAAQALGASVSGSLKSVDVSGLSNPELEKAAAGEPACKSLNS
jgi:hypothetical protein